jgi:hypothetical protein
LARDVAAIGDHSVDSPEWAKYIVDWPSEYHFSRLRTNLLRPMEISPGQRVVELGAGCGAITRWLGETGAEVIAVEGSLTRASIAARRCHDLRNVHIVADDLHAIPSLEADWVTLIGVLEYAPIFSQATDGVAATLEAARGQLKTGGAILIAIENQLGLKYFAGYPEDHVGERFFGLSGLYRPGGPVTFGRRDLIARLVNAGFPAVRLLFPWPDYKLPMLIVDARAAEIPSLDVATLVARHLGRDYSGCCLRAFSELLSWSVLQQNGLIPDLANSFLVVAAETEAALAARTAWPSTLAWNFTNDRRPPLQVTTRIVQEDGVLRVHKDSVHTGELEDEGPWRHQVVPVTDYVVGELLSLTMLRYAEAGDEAAFVSAGLSWVDLLLAQSWPHYGHRAHALDAWSIQGNTVDLIPGNILVTPAGDLHLIDQEWTCINPVSLAWRLLRGLLCLPAYFVRMSSFCCRTIVEIARLLLVERQITIDPGDVATAGEWESRFQSWVRAIPQERLRRPEAMSSEPLALRMGNAFELADDHPRMKAAAETASRDVQALHATNECFRQKLYEVDEHLRRTQEQLQNEFEQRQQAIEQRQQTIEQLQSTVDEVARLQRRVDQFESHPLLGRALRGRRRLKAALHRAIDPINKIGIRITDLG